MNWIDLMTAKNIELGNWGEKIAIEKLKRMRWKILGTNEKVPLGELDVVARDGKEIVIVEVRTRTCGRMLPPEFTVGPSKLKKLVRSGKIFVEKIKWEGPWRIDLIAITVLADNEWKIEHYRNITDGEFCQ